MTSHANGGGQTICDEGEGVFRNVTSHTNLLNLLIFNRTQVKCFEHVKFLDNELSQFYANFSFPMPSHVIILTFNTYYN